MPSRITPEKAENIAKNYIDNNCDKAKTLIASGYSYSYAHCGLREETYNNILVKQAISNIQAKLEAKTVDTAENWLNRVRDTECRAKTANDRPSEARQQDLEAKHKGYFEKDNLQKQQGIVIMIAPPAGPQQADTGPKQVESEVMGNG